MKACPSCTCAVLYGDTSGVPEQTLPTVEAAIQRLGFMRVDSSQWSDSYDCDVCGTDCLDGNHSTLEAV